MQFLGIESDGMLGNRDKCHGAVLTLFLVLLPVLIGEVAHAPHFKKLAELEFRVTRLETGRHQQDARMQTRWPLVIERQIGR